MSKVNFFRLTATQYDSLDNKDEDTVYFLTDSKTIVLGTEKYVNEKKADKFLVQRVFAHDTYGTVAYLDADNSMDLSGYFADGICQFEIYLVSATPEVTGNIVLNIGAESFTVPVTGTTLGAFISMAIVFSFCEEGEKSEGEVSAKRISRFVCAALLLVSLLMSLSLAMSLNNNLTVYDTRLYVIFKDIFTLF